MVQKIVVAGITWRDAVSRRMVARSSVEELNHAVVRIIKLRWL